MAVDMFMKIPNIKGESKDAVHKEEIDVLAWSWGASQSGTTHLGTGGGAGKVNVQDLSFTKYVDKSSHLLLSGCAKGTHFTDALLTVRKAGDKPLEYIKITMNEVMVTSVSTGAHSALANSTRLAPPNRVTVAVPASANAAVRRREASITT